MSLIVHVGYSEKQGQPDFGSIGASCDIECELDGRLALDDADAFPIQVRELYSACAQAVRDELARRASRFVSLETGTSSLETNQPPEKGNGKISNGGKPAANNGHSATVPRGSPDHWASSRQRDYLAQLARQIPALGVRRLAPLAQRICGKPLEELSSFEASTLIDTLKAIKTGQLDVDATLPGETE